MQCSQWHYEQWSSWSTHWRRTPGPSPPESEPELQPSPSDTRAGCTGRALAGMCAALNDAQPERSLAIIISDAWGSSTAQWLWSQKPEKTSWLLGLPCHIAPWLQPQCQTASDSAIMKSLASKSSLSAVGVQCQARLESEARVAELHSLRAQGNGGIKFIICKLRLCNKVYSIVNSEFESETWEILWNMLKSEKYWHACISRISVFHSNYKHHKYFLVFHIQNILCFVSW